MPRWLFSRPGRGGLPLSPGLTSSLGCQGPPPRVQTVGLHTTARSRGPARFPCAYDVWALSKALYVPYPTEPFFQLQNIQPWPTRGFREVLSWRVGEVGRDPKSASAPCFLSLIPLGLKSLLCPCIPMGLACGLST